MVSMENVLQLGRFDFPGAKNQEIKRLGGSQILLTPTINKPLIPFA
jgi:hypothetical protein